MVVGSSKVSAGFEGLSKTCVGPGGAEAEQGSTITCTVSAAGLLAGGQSFIVSPTSPTNSTVTACSGFNGTGYVSAGTLTGNACTYAITALTPVPGNNVIGTETVLIPSNTPEGTSVTQQETTCEPSAAPPLPAGCSPTPVPMGVNGPGSCVGGTAFQGFGGCQPAPPSGPPSPGQCFVFPAPIGVVCFPSPPSGGPTPPSCLPIPGLPPPLGCPSTPTPTPPGGGPGGNPGGSNPGGTTGGITGTQAGNTGLTSGVKAATTPFTAGPVHPAPILGITLASAGALLALATALGPGVIRRWRRRVANARDDW